MACEGLPKAAGGFKRCEKEACERTGVGDSIDGADKSAVPAGKQREIVFGGGRELFVGMGLLRC